MRLFDWIETLRNARRAARRNIRVRQREYRGWHGPTVMCEVLEQRLVPTLTASIFALGPDYGEATEGESGMVTLAYWVTLSGLASSDVTIPWSVNGSGSSPTDNSDFSGSLSGTATITEGNSAAWISVSVTGDTIVEPDETFEVTLGTPTGATLGSSPSADGSILNDDCAEVTIGDASVTEGGALSFTLTLLNVVKGGFSLAYSTADGTATIADSDYTAVAAGSVTFAGTLGETQTITINTTSDTKVEVAQTLLVTLGTITGPDGVYTSGWGTGTITNDDSATITIADATVTEGGDLSFVLTLSNDVEGGVSVAYSTSDIAPTTAATSGSPGDNDYTAVLDGSATFTGTSGETVSITISTNSDDTVEPNETLAVNLGTVTGPAGVTASGSGTGAITNDDDSLITIEGNEAAPGDPVIFTVSLSNAVQGGVTVPYSTEDDTAISAMPDNDYTAVLTASLILVGTAGESQTLSIATVAVWSPEPAKEFAVNLGTLIVAAGVTGVSTTGRATGKIATIRPNKEVTINNFTHPAGYKNAQQILRGTPPVTVIPGSRNNATTTSVDTGHGGIFTSIPAGELVGTYGADPCVGAIIVHRTAGVVTKVFVYHFKARDNPPSTLARDRALVAGAEVTLFGGSNGHESSNGLYKSIIDLIPVGGPVALRGIVTNSSLWVDQNGDLFIHAVEQAFPENDP